MSLHAPHRGSPEHQSLRNTLERAPGRAFGRVEHERSAFAVRLPNALVEAHRADGVDIDSEMAAANAGHGSAEPLVLGVAGLIDQKPRPKRVSLLLEITSRGTVATLYGVEEINGRPDAGSILLVHRFLNDFSRRARLQSAPKMTIEAHFEEAVGVLDRARLGDHHQEALFRDEKEIYDVEK